MAHRMYYINDDGDYVCSRETYEKVKEMSGKDISPKQFHAAYRIYSEVDYDALKHLHREEYLEKFISKMDIILNKLDYNTIDLLWERYPQYSTKPFESVLPLFEWINEIK